MPVDFVDAEGNIIVPKAVRPIIKGIDETALGTKQGARRQYRHGRLHIRDYDTHYTVHIDRVDPRVSPIGHLLVDAPEYIVGAAAAVLAARQVGSAVYKKRRKDGSKNALAEAAVAGWAAGSAAGEFFFKATNNFKKR